ncbi:MAG: hypothetical protein M9920_01610 [Verrucomicrobiae bacterium]|nr:hypothetical protein [Verrucomicrobiae bacterium]
MSWWKKRTDPISDRAQELNAKIAALEAEILQLDEQLHHAPEGAPRLRSTAVPHGATVRHTLPTATTPSPTSPSSEPVFEEISQERITTENEMPNLPEHYNEFGTRKLDLPAVIQKIRRFFTGPNTSNPQLVNYLAAGGVQGLRPLRKERRVARNRFIFFAAVLFLVLFGTVWWYLHHR